MTTKDATQTNIYTPIDDHINLYNIVGNTKCTQLLTAAVNTHYNDRADGKNPILKPILFLGERGSGKSTYSRALGNALAFSFKHELGTTLNRGGQCVTDFVLGGDEETCYFISKADQLLPYCVDKLYKVITQGTLYVNDPIERRTETYDMPGRLFVFSARNVSRLIEPLLKHCIVIHLEKYRVEEVFLILQQRSKFWNLISAYSALSKIADYVKGDAGAAISILERTYRVMRADDRNELKEEDVNKAIGYGNMPMEDD